MIPLDRVREMLAAATAGPWDNGALQVYSVAGCPLHGPGGNPLADASVHRCVCRVVVYSVREDDRPLIAAAPDLARDVLTLADALRTERAAREAAEAQHAADVAAAVAGETRRCEAVCRAEALAWSGAYQRGCELCADAIAAPTGGGE